MSSRKSYEHRLEINVMLFRNAHYVTALTDDHEINPSEVTSERIQGYKCLCNNIFFFKKKSI